MKIKSSFKLTSSFLTELTKKTLEKKGFSQSKLITNWEEIIGSELSKKLKPSKMKFSGKGLGATIFLDLQGSYGPEISLQLEVIKEKINRVYGYAAITKITLRQSKEDLETNNKFRNTESSVKLTLEETQNNEFDRVKPPAASEIEKVKDEQVRLKLKKLGKYISISRKHNI